MIPVGNWADRIEELESDNFDLVEENSRLDDEVGNLLYEVDRLEDQVLQLEAENRDWEGVVECILDRAESAELEAAQWESTYLFSEIMRNEVQKRANSWFEIAKNMSRARNMWVDIAEEQMDRADVGEVLLDEFKAALRTLSR